MFLCAHARLGSSHARLGTYDVAFQGVGADWGGTEGIGTELRKIKKELGQLDNPSDPAEVCVCGGGEASLSLSLFRSGQQKMKLNKHYASPTLLCKPLESGRTVSPCKARHDVPRVVLDCEALRA